MEPKFWVKIVKQLDISFEVFLIVKPVGFHNIEELIYFHDIFFSNSKTRKGKRYSCHGLKIIWQ